MKLSRLPDTVSWFEPPQVCRWETDEEFIESKKFEKPKSKSQDDDLDDIDEHLVEPDKTKNTKAVKKSFDRKVRVLEDFNLLDVPGKVCLQPLFEEFVIPMLPDGYEIKFEQKGSKVNERSMYRSDGKVYTIEDILYQTRNPKYLFPNCQTKKMLKVVKVKSKYADLSPGLEYSDEENDESMYSESDQACLSANIYMFSKFMRDLEDLADNDFPSFEKKIAEISSNLSMASEINDAGLERQSSGISLTKTNSILSNSDSEAESESDKEEVDEIAVTMDGAVKQSNIKRCSGRWSTRDIHDVKFNEDKLTIQFRTGRLGTFGFASRRYSNFPYQSWELKPEFKTYVS